MRKTNAVRLLSSHGIAFEVAEYVYDEKAAGALVAAEKLEVKPERIFKTLVTRDDKGQVWVFCVRGNGALHLKKAALAAGTKKIRLVSPEELFSLTGYIRGGCSPIGMKTSYPVVIDELATQLDWLYVNGGARGLQIKMCPANLLQITRARKADLV